MRVDPKRFIVHFQLTKEISMKQRDVDDLWCALGKRDPSGLMLFYKE